MTPSLETLTGLYRAALKQEQAAKDNVARIEALAVKHGYTVEQIFSAARGGARNASTFEQCVRRTKNAGGRLKISCRLGFWSVEGPDVEFVETNARQYWIQYYADGEYAELLNGGKRSHA